jgi:beta-phosphoglucomutase-like phosphatase (HAD superfamily)
MLQKTIASAQALRFDEFSAVLTRDDCQQPKPAAEIYLIALEKLGVQADEALAIEDSAASVAAATAAGIFTIATPGAFTSGLDFSAADKKLDSLTGFRLNEV